MPFRDPPPPPKPPSLPGASRPAPVPGRAPVRPPAIAPAAAAAAATAAEQNAVTASLSRPRKWRKMRRNETIFALAAVAGCLVAGGIAALVIGTDVSAGGPKRSRAGSTMRSHGTAAHAEGDGRRADGDGRRAAPAAVSHFAAIGTELQHNRHLPLQGLDGGDPRRQRGELCTVGNVPISLRLPAEKVQLLPDGPPSVLECRPDGDQSWTFVSVTAGRDRRCGGAAVERGMLTAWIDVRESVTVPGHVEQWRAREALASTVIAISAAGHEGQDTHVQLGRPVEHGPLHVKRFFFDEALRVDASAGGKPLLHVEVPVSPWVVDLRLDGTCGSSSSSASPHAGRLQPGAEPPGCTLLWAWAGATGQPFMETTLTLGPSGPLSSGERLELPFRLTSSRVLDPWDSYRRLADVQNAGQERSGLAVLPEPHAFADVVQARVPQADRAGIGAIAQFADVVRRYRLQVPGAPRALHECLQKLSPEEALPLAMWKDRFRELLRETPGYRAWQASADGRREIADGHADTSAYWSHLQADLAAHREEATEVALCCMLEELDAVPDGKRAAQQLLKDIGAGDAAFSGDLGASFPGIGRSVLVSFARHRSHTTAAADDASGAAPR